MSLTVGQIIGKTLKAYGVPYVTGLPGHGNWCPSSEPLRPAWPLGQATLSDSVHP